MSRVGPSSPSPLPAAVAGGVEIHTCTRGVRGQQAADSEADAGTGKGFHFHKTFFSLGTFLLCNKNFKGIYLFICFLPPLQL